MTPPEPPPELPPEPLPEPEPAPEPEAVPEPPPEPMADEELPPPPGDMAERTKSFPPVKTKRSGAMATLRRAVTIFEKDMRTMAKHGLVSAVILLIFLGVVFTIMSFAMSQAMKFDIGEMEGDGEGPGTLPGSTDHVPPVADAGNDRAVSASTSVTLDASGSTDNEGLFYFVWNFDESGREMQLYGESVTHVFYATGHYEVNLVVVDTSWNFDEDNMTIDVNALPGDTESPMANAGNDTGASVGTTFTFNGSGSTDNVDVVNWTWMFRDFGDRIDRVLFGERPSYRFDNTGTIWVQLVARDAAGNTGQAGIRIDVYTDSGDTQSPEARADMPHQINVGERVQLDASESFDNQGISDYIWFVKQNNTMRTFNGQTAEFVADRIGMYEVLLVVRDAAGNVGTSDGGVIVYPADVDVDMIAWDSTPFGTDVSFNLLTYAYGIALLSSVIFIGGLFAKGFTHEISKGTIKVLFFGPISVTTMIFSKILYPIVIGPIFIFPLTLFSLAMFNQSPGDILMITLVAYLLCVVTMLSAAYGSCIIYAAAKRMVIKPSIVSRMFLYFSLLLTLTVFEWSTFVMDSWLETDSWGNMYDSYHGIATISPFHQGGIFLSGQILGTMQSPDYFLLIIPAALIILGILASKKLYSDIFSRE